MLADHAIKIELVRLEVENNWQDKIKELEKQQNSELEEMKQQVQEVTIRLLNGTLKLSS